jgi:pyridoxamine 5'-phosphate oxidase
VAEAPRPGENRQEYERGVLLETHVDPDPIAELQKWIDHAAAGGVPEPTAMTVATASLDGRPSARIVLCRGVGPEGLDFYTNYESRKSLEAEHNPHAALVFYWPQVQRQVRVEGTLHRLTEAESDAYFGSRPRGSQLGAWASDQSQVIEDRNVLESRLARLDEEYRDRPIPRPPHWGGFRVAPSVFEFWQGRRNRLHDRLRYRRTNPGGWKIERIAP